MFITHSDPNYEARFVDNVHILNFAEIIFGEIRQNFTEFKIVVQDCLYNV